MRHDCYFLYVTRLTRDTTCCGAGDVVCEITIGCGPAGELRYPAYPEAAHLWRFPGVGEFQCYDAYMLADLRAWANACDHPDWGNSGPHDAGHYCERDAKGFFHPDGAWKSPYGDFFLDWYSSLLRSHAEELLDRLHRICLESGRPRRVRPRLAALLLCVELLCV